MKVNYVLMYGTPYLRYRAFETFENVSKFLVNKGIVDYSIFKKLEDDEEIEMIYRDIDINYLKSIIKEVREYIDKFIKANYEDIFNQEQKDYMIKILEILNKENKWNKEKLNTG